VTDDQIVADVVRAWVALELQGEPGIADRAAARAWCAYLEGASVTEACQEAMEFVGSWVRHPANWRGARSGPVALAS
jgi:hypothetical protein